MASQAGSGIRVSDRWCVEFETMMQHLRNGRAASALLVLRNADLSDAPAFPFESYVALLSGVSPRADASLMLVFMSELEKSVGFQSPHSAVYFARFSRWLLQDFLAECVSNLEKHGRHAASALEDLDGCASVLTAERGCEDLELKLRGGPTSAHGFAKGESIFVTFPHTATVGENSLDAVVQASWGSDSGEDMCLLVKLSVPIPDITHVVGRTCRADKVANAVGFHRALEALKLLVTPENDMRPFNDIFVNSMHQPTGQEKLLCAEVITTNVVPAAIEGVQWGLLNESQKSAVSAALTQRLTLIQGPPGTGKTHCSVNVVQSLVAEQSALGSNSRILVCAGSNVAVDNLLDGLIKEGVNAVRIGPSSAVRDDLEAYSVECMAKRRLASSSESGGAWKGARSLWKLEKRILKGYDVVCATNVGAAGGILRKLTFDTVLMDEAAQSTEPVTLIPIVRGGVRRVILVGDHRQLPPTVICRTAAVEGLEKSLFDRLVVLGVRPHMLNTQYRMHPAIVRYPSDAFYDGQLGTGIDASDRPPPRGFDWPSMDFPVAFCNVAGTEQKHGNSYANLAETCKIESVLEGLLRAGDLQPNDIGIISPYSGQVSNVRQRLRGTGPNCFHLVEVASVDGFQGREKELIIVSTTRANEGGDLGFVKDLRRMNVALTRARRGIIVVGHEGTLARDATGWGPWLRWIRQTGSATSPHAVQSSHHSLWQRRVEARWN